MKRIPLTRGKFALVDDEDYEYLMQWKWFAHRRACGYYAARNSKYDLQYKRQTIAMHAEIFGSTCDHKNRNTLDNRRHNLRKASRSEQCINQGIRKDNTSGYKGVTFSPACNKWMARVSFGNERIYLGVFRTKEDAAKARDRAALKYHGEFAVLNLPSKAA